MIKKEEIKPNTVLIVLKKEEKNKPEIELESTETRGHNIMTDNTIDNTTNTTTQQTPTPTHSPKNTQIKKFQSTLTSPLIEKDEFIREMTKRNGYALSLNKEVLNTIISIFIDSVLQQFPIFIRGWIELKYIKLPARNGVNAVESVKQGKTVREDFDETVKSVLGLSQNIRFSLRGQEWKGNQFDVGEGGDLDEGDVD